MDNDFTVTTSTRENYFFFFLQTGIVDVEIGKEKVARHSAHFNLLAFLRYDSDV